MLNETFTEVGSPCDLWTWPWVNKSHWLLAQFLEVLFKRDFELCSKIMVSYGYNSYGVYLVMILF